MYIERVPNRNSPPAVLLRSSHWDHGKIRKVTHANLSKLPQPLVDGIALLLHGGTVVGPGSPAVRILDWLARRHLQDGCLALYDLTSVWYTGEHCELARRGYSRDGKRGSRQILVGLLCDAAGRPVSAEVCAGNTASGALLQATEAALVEIRQAALDGLYVIRAQVPPEQLDDAGVVRAYKSLAAVERAFRHLKTVDLELRPFYVRDPDRVRAHTLVCLLAYHLEWHLRQKLAPLLYEEQDRAAAERRPMALN